MILKEYLAELLNNRFVVEMFIERHRGRLGKVLKPEDESFDLIVEAFLEGKIPQAKDI